MLNIRKAKLFRRPTILVMYIYLIFFTKICGFSFFGHPVWLKQSFIELGYPFLKKSSQNAPHQKGKTFQETQYFDQCPYISFFPTKMCGFSFFGHPLRLKQPFIGLGYPFFKKGSQNAPHQKGKTFQETKNFDHAHISQFFSPKNVDFHFLDTLYC